MSLVSNLEEELDRTEQRSWEQLMHSHQIQGDDTQRTLHTFHAGIMDGWKSSEWSNTKLWKGRNGIQGCSPHVSQDDFEQGSKGPNH